jgi:hypothetical protein
MAFQFSEGRMFVGKALQLYVTLMKHIMLIELKYWSSTLYSFSRNIGCRSVDYLFDLYSVQKAVLGIIFSLLFAIAKFSIPYMPPICQ